MIELATFKCSLYSEDHNLIGEYGNVTILKNDIEQFWIRCDNNNDKGHIGWAWTISDETIFSYPPKMIYLIDSSSSSASSLSDSGKSNNNEITDMEIEMELDTNINYKSNNMDHTSMFVVMRDEIDTKALLQLIYECNLINKLFIRLDILLRDSFFTSLYSELSTKVKANYTGEYHNDATWIRSNQNVNDNYETFFDIVLLFMGIRPLQDRYLYDVNNDADKVDKQKYEGGDENGNINEIYDSKNTSDNNNNDNVNVNNNSSSSSGSGSNNNSSKHKSKSAKQSSFGFPYLSSVLHMMVSEIIDKTNDASNHMNMMEMNVDKFLEIVCNKDLLMHVKSRPREMLDMRKQSISLSDSRGGTQTYKNISSNYYSGNSGSSGRVRASLEYGQLLRPSQCVYCQVQDSDENALIVHPYVEHDFQSRPIYICNTCHGNWKTFRDAAIEDDALVYEGEVNEELCAICSDSPAELVMCGSCPRSFCIRCIQEILTIAEQNVMNQSDDWLCMCCATKVTLNRANTFSTITSNSDDLLDSCSPAGSRSFSKKKSNANNDDSRTSTSARNSSKKRQSKKKQNIDLKSKKKQNIDLKSEDASFTITMKNRCNDSNGTTKTKTQDKDVSSSTSNNGGGNTIRSASSASQITSNMPALSSFDDVYYFEQYVSYLHKRGNTVVNMRDLSEDKIKKQQRKKLNASTKVKGKDNSKNKASGNTAEVETEAEFVARIVDPRDELGTEDFCYLCKDGGDLIECDHSFISNHTITSSSSSPNKQRKTKAQHVGNPSQTIPVPCSCMKVYHQYCLSYLVPEDSEWNCPKHYCDACGSTNIYYMCKFCPISICTSCPKKFVDNYGLNKYIHLEWSTHKSFYQDLGYYDNDSDNVSLIVCENCINILSRCSSDCLQNLFNVNSINQMNIKLLVEN